MEDQTERIKKVAADLGIETARLDFDICWKLTTKSNNVFSIPEGRHMV